ncbi:unnamed protein product [Diplocarpon coronariae]
MLGGSLSSLRSVTWDGLHVSQNPKNPGSLLLVWQTTTERALGHASWLDMMRALGVCASIKVALKPPSWRESLREADEPSNFVGRLRPWVPPHETHRLSQSSSSEPDPKPKQNDDSSACASPVGKVFGSMVEQREGLFTRRHVVILAPPTGSRRAPEMGR